MKSWQSCWGITWNTIQVAPIEKSAAEKVLHTGSSQLSEKSVWLQGEVNTGISYKVKSSRVYTKRLLEMLWRCLFHIMNHNIWFGERKAVKKKLFRKQNIARLHKPTWSTGVQMQKRGKKKNSLSTSRLWIRLNIWQWFSVHLSKNNKSLFNPSSISSLLASLLIGETLGLSIITRNG